MLNSRQHSVLRGDGGHGDLADGPGDGQGGERAFLQRISGLQQRLAGSNGLSYGLSYGFGGLMTPGTGNTSY